jgi:predicted outer membrane repeat protein
LEALEDRCVPSTLKHHSPPPPAPTLTVINTGDSGPGSLRYEIAAANPGDTINFAPTLDGHTIWLYSGNELDIDKNLTIQGPGAGLLTIDSNLVTSGNSRIFEVGSGATVALSGMTLDGGGGFASNVSLGRVNDGFGGAILNFGTLTITGCTLSNNSAAQPPDSAAFGWPPSEGGAIYNDGVLTVTGCTLVNNSADYGGGISNESFGTATVNSCTFTGNTAFGAGGGIYNANYLTVLDSIFSGNIVSGNPFAPQNIYGSYTDGGGNTFN